MITETSLPGAFLNFKIMANKKNKTPHFAFYPKDFFTDTLDLSDELVGQYIRILCRQWFSGPVKKIPRDLEEYFEETPEGWINSRLEKERDKALKAWQQRKDASDRAAKIRQGSPAGQPSGPSDDGPNQNQNQNQKKKKNLNQNQEQVPLPWDSDRFEAVWKTWKDYKKKEHSFRYKSPISEKAALAKLQKLAGGDEEMAYLIIFNAVAGGWKGFFELSERDLKQLKPQANDDGLDDIRRKYDL